MNDALKVLIIWILIVNSNLCLSQNRTNELCSLRVDTVIKEKVQGEVNWIVYCSILNNSKSKLKYWSMSCSWTDFFQVADPEILIDGFECKEENSPTIVEVEPNRSRQIALRLYQKDKAGNLSKKTKIGFRYINAKKTLNLNETIDDANLVWSNQLILL